LDVLLNLKDVLKTSWQLRVVSWCYHSIINNLPISLHRLIKTINLKNTVGTVPLGLDLLIRHERWGSISKSSLHGHLHYLTPHESWDGSPTIWDCHWQRKFICVSNVNGQSREPEYNPRWTLISHCICSKGVFLQNNRDPYKEETQIPLSHIHQRKILIISLTQRIHLFTTHRSRMTT
jgi:hypothetical protein